MPVFRFGSCVFDSRSRTVAQAGVEAKLSHRAFEALQLLVFRHPEAVSKHDLSSALWPDTFVNLTNLNNVIAEIRKAIGDSSHSVVVTKHRFGYAMGVPVLSDSALTDSAPFVLLIAGRTIHLPAGDSLVGRSPEAAVMIDDPSVSRQHAILHVQDDRALLEDLGSKNGTFIGDDRVIDSHPLADGSVVRFGSICGIFQLRLGAGTTITLEGRSPMQSAGR